MSDTNRIKKQSVPVSKPTHNGWHIQPSYALSFDPATSEAPYIKEIFSTRESMVIWMAVASCSCHKPGVFFMPDCIVIGKAFRKKRPRTPQALEKLLWNTARDKDLKCPWRPTMMPLKIITSEPETEEEFNARVDRTRSEWLNLIEELRLAMNGTIKVKYEVMQ